MWIIGLIIIVFSMAVVYVFARKMVDMVDGHLHFFSY